MASLTLRPYGPGDDAYAVEAVRAVQPHHPWSAEEIAIGQRILGRMGRFRRLVVEEGVRPIGWFAAVAWHESPADEGRLTVFVADRTDGRLDAVWELAEGVLRHMEARLGATTVWEDDEAQLATLERRGWERKRRERFWRLELTGQRDRLVGLRDVARRRVEAAGLRVATAAELGGEAVYPQLYEVDEKSSEDIPRSVTRAPMPYDAWTEAMRTVSPDRVWVAVRDGRPVGMSYIDYDSTPVQTGYTGVLREHRGAGLARALKLETLVQAIDLGIEAVETDNDSENAPILHLNEELGYREIPGQLRLYKPLAGA
jgi:GNAT superfamily N-acetyltransferase